MITEKLCRYVEYGRHKFNAAGEMLLQKESSHHKLVASCCMGVYVAFSPFICCHTIMIFLFGWLFSLNIPIMFIVSWFINNPWTMVPIYAFDCVVGNYIFAFLGVNSMQLNPSWMMGLNDLLSTYLGISGISFWSFMVGGNLFALFIGGILYPVFSYFFTCMRRSDS